MSTAFEELSVAPVKGTSLCAAVAAVVGRKAAAVRLLLTRQWKENRRYSRMEGLEVGHGAWKEDMEGLERGH